ncbi:MAG: hypothetical protein MJ160_05050 [Treponema sp.]|nr:hypothetical protein [Treponema sp.]
MMKINKKILISAALFCGFTAILSAQNERIELPDLTTVVSGNNQSEKAEAPELTDYTNLPLSIKPVALEYTQEEVVYEPFVDEGFSDDDGLSTGKYGIQGQIGGGYPLNFYGDFSLNAGDDENPFNLSFLHNTIGSYGTYSPEDGYNFSDTKVGISQQFVNGNASFKISGMYDGLSNGLQGKSTNVSGIKQGLLNAGFDYVQKIPVKNKKIGLQTGAGISGDLYNRYVDCPDSSTISTDWIKKSYVFSFEPYAFFNGNFGNFSTGLKADYLVTIDCNKVLNTPMPLIPQQRLLNRGEIKLNAVYDSKNSWELKAVADASVVFGSHLNENKVLFPFTAGIESKYFDLKGGMESSATNISSLERKNRFSAFSFIPSETSFWYGTFMLKLPLEKVSLNAGLTYKTTAFDNGVWEPDYSAVPGAEGVYQYTCGKKDYLNAEFNAAFRYNNFDFGTSLKICFMDTAVLDADFYYDVFAKYTTRNKKWDLIADINGVIGGEDAFPVMDFSSYYKITSSVQAGVAVQDMLKLFTGSTRTYAGQYVKESGNITLIVKFRG